MTLRARLCTRILSTSSAARWAFTRTGHASNSVSEKSKATNARQFSHTSMTRSPGLTPSSASHSFVLSTSACNCLYVQVQDVSTKAGCSGEFSAHTLTTSEILRIELIPIPGEESSLHNAALGFDGAIGGRC